VMLAFMIIVGVNDSAQSEASGSWMDLYTLSDTHVR